MTQDVKNKIHDNASYAWRLTGTLSLSLAACVLLSSSAGAQIIGQPSTMSTLVCAVADLAFGNVGRALATLAIIALGMGAMIGKVSWGLAIIVATGIALLFGAHAISWYLASGGTAWVAPTSCGPPGWSGDVPGR